MALYFGTSPYHQGLNNPNEMVRVYMSVAAIDNGTLSIDKVIQRWGFVDDKSIRNGRLYSSKAPLQSLIGIPVYYGARGLLNGLNLPIDARHVTFVLRFFGSALPGLLFSWALLFFAQRRADALTGAHQQGTALGLALALGTMHYPYALTFTGHMLASALAGGCFIGVAVLLNTAPGSLKWRNVALITGALAGGTPFAEYPAALVALPALLCAFIVAPGLQTKRRLFLWLLLGGILPFCLGLWAHQVLWGSPFATGYSFLENKSYVEYHKVGFFGVTTPKLNVISSVLLSPETGLFFFSPFLALGLVPMLQDARGLYRPQQQKGSTALARMSLVTLVLEIIFIGSHSGWRGGWTLGPRYIIPVVVVLGFWSIEALSYKRLRGLLMALSAAAIFITGPAAAIYPHLSDVYSNPLYTFVLPTYLRGEMSYGLAHALGFQGHSANIPHLSLISVAGIYAAFSGLKSIPRRLSILAICVLVCSVVIGLTPERNPSLATAENQRLWSFWEPARKSEAINRRSPRYLTNARSIWRTIQVQRIDQKGEIHPCMPTKLACRYGPLAWQHFGPEHMSLGGHQHPILFMHPVGGERVEAIVPIPLGAQEAILRYGLSDESLRTDNPYLVEVVVHQSSSLVAKTYAGDNTGFRRMNIPLTSMSPLLVSISVQEDGARVFGWDIEFLGPTL